MSGKLSKLFNAQDMTVGSSGCEWSGRQPAISSVYGNFNRCYDYGIPILWGKGERSSFPYSGNGNHTLHAHLYFYHDFGTAHQPADDVIAEYPSGYL